MATAPAQIRPRAPRPALVRSSGTALERVGPAYAHLLDRFDGATLAQIDAVSLLDRVDTKFVLSAAQLGRIVPALAAHYRVLDIDGRRLHRYRTRYFDTPSFALYRRHHAGETVRRKVRSRAYVDSGLAFFEVKAKTSQGRTVKSRLPTDTMLTRLTPAARLFLSSLVPPDEQRLEAMVRNDFSRITLVGKDHAERLTLDLGIRFAYDGRSAILPSVAIAELKQGVVGHDSPFMRQMRRNDVQPTCVSKYCLGVALLAPQIEHHAFAATLRTIERVAQDTDTF